MLNIHWPTRSLQPEHSSRNVIDGGKGDAILGRHIGRRGIERRARYPTQKGVIMRGVISIIIGLALIVGGLSGKLVLVGTHSGVALAVVGGVVAAIGVVRVIKSR